MYTNNQKGRTKTREVISRHVSPAATPVHDSSIPSPNQSSSSPTQRKQGRASRDARRQRSFEDSSFAKGLWPSTATVSSPWQSLNKKTGTLADHLGNERLRDFLDWKGRGSTNDSSMSAALGRQRSCSETSRFENDDRDGDVKKSTKENHRLILGGSMRYTGKLLFPGRKSSSSSSSNGIIGSAAPVVPTRFSVDENALYKKSSRRSSDPFKESPLDTESECSDVSSSASNLSSTGTGKKPSGIEVPSRYMNDVISRGRRGTSDQSILHPVSFNEGTRSSRFTIKGAIRRAGSLTGYGSAMSQWALSPGRSGLPPMSVENKEKLQSFSSLKPPSSPSRHKGVEKLLNLGLDLFKSKKSSSYSSPTSSASVENVHQLRMLHNSLVQWQYANARADAANSRITNQAERNLASALVSLTKLQHTVLHKRLQLEREQLEMKLCTILHSQIRPLENWGDLERQHTMAITKTSECLQSIICRVPFINGAKVEPRSTLSALRQVSDVTTAVKANLTNLLPVCLVSQAESTIPLLSELARVAMQEKLILEECLEYLRAISKLEVLETSLMCGAVQLSKQKQPQEQLTKELLII